MVLKLISRRRRLLAHILTCSFCLYLLWNLSRKAHQDSAKTAEDKGRRTNDVKAPPPPPDVEEDLRKLFRKADASADGKLSKKELAWAISKSVEAHLMSALKNNFRNFFSLDKLNKNGQVEWDEWLAEFNKRAVDSGEGLNDRFVKERLAAAKAAWSESARSNPDALNIDEFLSFTHPESSHSILAQEAEDLFSRHDVNGDGIITSEEYQKDPYIEFEEEELVERRRTFSEAIDANKDGHADKREILTFLDPKHPFRSAEEAQRLINISDEDQDGVLMLEEILAHSNSFINSRWVSPAKVFHGDLQTSF